MTIDEADTGADAVLARATPVVVRRARIVGRVVIAGRVPLA